MLSNQTENLKYILQQSLTFENCTSQSKSVEAG